MLNSIEMLKLDKLFSNDLTTSWEIIELNQITIRRNSLVAPFSATEVLIAGGVDDCG